VFDPVVSAFDRRKRPHRVLRVLVVNDQPHLRMLLCDVLTYWGCEADAVTDPVDGLERLESGAYDVLVTDVRMRRLNGVDLIARARERDAALRVVMLTSSGVELGPADRRLGFTVLRKPFDLGQLKTAVVDHVLR
jgi:two-component system, cell cycle response regulator CpdR